MVEEYIKLLESFKRNQLSKLIEKISTKAFSILQSEYVSAQVPPYFEKINAEGPPFSDFALDPDNISQIKKWMNALYYARLTFIDLEKLDVRDAQRRKADVYGLYSETIDKAYDACFLATDLDVDFKDMFQDEFAALVPQLAKIKKLAESHTEETKKAIDEFSLEPYAYQAGEITGNVADQLRPPSADVDYNFLMNFTTKLPGHIEKLTKKIQKFSSEINEKEPKLNQAKLDEIKQAALNILSDIENIKGSSLLISLKFINYIHIIRNMITLCMTTLDQLGELNDSSQDVIREKLAQLKYTVLPALFGLIDKIEVNSMLKPGTLSVPLMKQIQALYKVVLFLPKKVVDFSAKGEELLSIEDSYFIELRLELANKRIDAANKAIYEAEKAQQALTDFFDELSKGEYKDLSINELPAPIKEKLKKSYAIIRPYVKQLNPDFNEYLIASLLGTESWSSYVGRRLRRLRRQLPADHVSMVLAKEAPIHALITKKIRSQRFHAGLNLELIESVHEEAKLVLYPYSGKTNVYVIDEKKSLGIPSENPVKLKLKADELKALQTALLQLQELLQETNENAEILPFQQFTEEKKAKFLSLYATLHPYFSYMVPPKQRDSILQLDQYLTDLIANKTILAKDTPTTTMLSTLVQHNKTLFDTIQFKWANEDDAVYYDLGHAKFLTEEEHLLEEQRKLKFIKKDAYYDTEHNRFLTQEEALLDTTRTFKLIKSDNNVLLENPEQLTSAQAHQLCRLYRNKCKQLQVAEQNYDDFLKLFRVAEQNYDDLLTRLSAKGINRDTLKIALLDEKTIAQHHNKGINSDILKIARLDEKTKAQFRRLYAKGITGDTLKSDRLDEKAKALFLRLYNKGISEDIIKIALLDEKTKTQLHHLYINGGSGTIIKIALLDEKTKEKYRRLYNIVQPYFVSAIPAGKKNAAVRFDRYMVSLLSDRPVDKDSPPSIEGFVGLKSHFQRYFAKTTTKWHQKSLEYFQLAQTKFESENDASTLDASQEQRAGTDAREHFILKTVYSQSIHDFRIAFFGIVELFNKSIKEELGHGIPYPEMQNPSKRPQESKTVPYPEMEDPNTQLTQSKQVRALKEIFNSLYHLEGLSLDLEKLHNQNLNGPYANRVDAEYRKVLKGNFVYRILQAYGHINEIINLSQRLASDPHYEFIVRDLINKAQSLYATFQEHTSAYQVGHEEVGLPGAVQFDPLWYVLNTFFIGPQHIRSLKNTTYLTTEKLNELHNKAKESTMIIEKMINSSGSYFKLFLQTPNMIRLYQELTKKLNEFTTTTHDAVLTNIDKMQASIFTPMLLEADQWEAKLGLIPGSMAEPLRKITNEYYKGLLHPLELKSKQHIALVCDKLPLHKRTLQVNEAKAAAEKSLEKTKTIYVDVVALYQLIQKHKQLTYRLIPDRLKNHAEIARNKERIRTTYKEALPVLAKLRLDKHISIEATNYPEDHLFDAMCNQGLKSYHPKFTEVEGWVSAAYHYRLGLEATHQLSINTAQEKLAYLTTVDELQHNEKQQFIDDYTNEAFDKHLKTLCSRHIGLQNAGLEYRSELKIHLTHFKVSITNEAKTKDDINISLETQLKEKIGIFEKKYYAKYHQLDMVLNAISQFRAYFTQASTAIQNGTSIFESDITIGKKSELIDRLELIACIPNKAMLAEQDLDKRHLMLKEDLDARMKKIKNIVKFGDFKQTILSHAKPDILSFANLKRCLLWLLEALHLYTPTRKKLVQSTIDAVNETPKINELTKRFGLFARPDTPQTTTRFEPPVEPAAAAPAV